ncbi:hypothetical protein ABVF11_04985 [Pediococcus argentinicus]|uniref:hypothetical protein n=1 Tax=Pediococcus argentinicus TaxID=480391 RepID=UPI00338F3CE1
MKTININNLSGASNLLNTSQGQIRVKPSRDVNGYFTLLVTLSNDGRISSTDTFKEKDGYITILDTSYRLIK